MLEIEDGWLNDITPVEFIAAFGAEPGGIVGILGLPTVFVANENRCARRTAFSAFHAEFTLIYSLLKKS